MKFILVCVRDRVGLFTMVLSGVTTARKNINSRVLVSGGNAQAISMKEFGASNKIYVLIQVK